MRYLEIITLLEYDRSKTVQRLSIAVARAAEQDQSAKGQTAEQLFDQFEQADPTTNKQYVQWIADRYSRQQYTIEQLPDITQALTKFDQNKKQFQIRDINQYKQVNDLIAAANSVQVEPSGKQQRNADRQRAYEESEIIYSGPEGVLASPKTEFASCWLGRNTDFCTARTKTLNLFSDYDQHGKLYVWMPRNEGAAAKIQIFLPNANSYKSIEIKDSANRSIDSQLFRNKYMKIPAIRQIITSYANEQLEQKSQHGLTIYINYLQEPLPPQAIELLKKYTDFILPYTKNILKKRDAQLEQALLNSDDIFNAIEYAKHITGPWPELEQVIKKSSADPVYLEAAIAYAIEVKKKPWTEMESSMIRLNSFIDLFEYAKLFYPNGWPPLEDKILKAYEKTDYKGMYITYLTDYANNILKGPWPAAEKLLLTDPGTKSNMLWLYAQNVIKGPWPAAEKRMLTDQELQKDDTLLSKYLTRYAISILKKPWPPAETLIRKDTDMWLKYQKHFGLQTEHDFYIGQTVEVTDGPFKEFTGEIVNFKDNQAQLSIKIFGRSTPAYVPVEWLKEI